MHTCMYAIIVLFYLTKLMLLRWRFWWLLCTSSRKAIIFIISSLVYIFCTKPVMPLKVFAQLSITLESCDTYIVYHTQHPLRQVLRYELNSERLMRQKTTKFFNINMFRLRIKSSSLWMKYSAVNILFKYSFIRTKSMANHLQSFFVSL